MPLRLSARSERAPRKCDFRQSSRGPCRGVIVQTSHQLTQAVLSPEFQCIRFGRRLPGKASADRGPKTYSARCLEFEVALSAPAGLRKLRIVVVKDYGTCSVTSRLHAALVTLADVQVLVVNKIFPAVRRRGLGFTSPRYRRNQWSRGLTKPRRPSCRRPVGVSARKHS